MGFVGKYPKGYNKYNGLFRFVPVKNSNVEQWLQRGYLDKNERDNLAFSYGKLRKTPRVLVGRVTVETCESVFLVDYTSLSCVTLDTKKNRYLQNEQTHKQNSLVHSVNNDSS